MTDLTCTTCAGLGEVVVYGTTRAPLGSPPERITECPACDGTGTECCAYCERRPATDVLDGAACCDVCAPDVMEQAAEADAYARGLH